MKVKKLTLYLLLFLYLTSCRGTQSIISEADFSYEEPEKQYTTLFLFMTIKQDSINKKNIVNVTEKKEMDGIVHIGIEQEARFKPYLIVHMYEKDILKNTITQEHPLYFHREYVDSQNKLAYKYFELDSADFFVRVQKRKNNPATLVISEYRSEMETNELITIKL